MTILALRHVTLLVVVCAWLIGGGIVAIVLAVSLAFRELDPNGSAPKRSFVDIVVTDNHSPVMPQSQQDIIVKYVWIYRCTGHTCYVHQWSILPSLPSRDSAATTIERRSGWPFRCLRSWYHRDPAFGKANQLNELGGPLLDGERGMTRESITWGIVVGCPHITLLSTHPLSRAFCYTIPLQPIWGGLFANAAILGWPFPLALVLFRRRARRRLARGQCVRCGYPLASSSAVCTECGLPGPSAHASSEPGVPPA